jgi:hypothetical protein
MRPKHQIPGEFEEYRDERWRREGTRLVATVLDAERFVEQVGFAACMTDSRWPGPSLYVASAAAATPCCRVMCRRIRSRL